MAIYTGSAERSIKATRAALVNSVKNFEADPRANGRVIRDLVENDRRQFYSISIEMLRDLPDCRGIQFLVALLVANGLLLEALCDPALNKDQAIALGRAAVRVDPMADAALARGLADSETGQGSVLVRDAARLMDTLCLVGDPAHMMASMLRLLRHPNPVMRSKAVKVVGRGSKSAKWVRQRLNESDPRVRANAIEALWSIDNEEARSVLQFASADTNNRAAANALLGLYFLGENSVLGDLVKMAGHESALFRASAAWAMGEMGDPRFLESLRPMLNATDGTVRKRAFAALGQIKSATASSTAGCKWHVGARLLPADGSDTRKLMVAVLGEDPRDQPKISSLGFILSEGRSYVMNYKVTEGPPLEAMSVVFVMPRLQEAGSALHDTVNNCLHWKRSSDLWCILQYFAGGGATPAEGQEPDPPVFTASPEALHSTLVEPANRMQCADLWTSLVRATKTDAAARGKRHIIVLAGKGESGIAPPDLAHKVRSARLPIHAIAPAPNAYLAEFCASVEATFQVCAEDTIADAVRQAYLTCLGRYEIAYPAIADAQSLKLRVHAPGGWGEAVVTY